MGELSSHPRRLGASAAEWSRAEQQKSIQRREARKGCPAPPAGLRAQGPTTTTAPSSSHHLSFYLSPTVPAPARARALTLHPPHTQCVCQYVHVCVESARKREREEPERERESLCVVQPEGFLLRPTPLDKTLSERHGDSEGGRGTKGEKHKTSRVFFLPSYYTFHLKCLNKIHLRHYTGRFCSVPHASTPHTIFLRLHEPG